MLNKVAMARDKKLQAKQILEVDKWFQRNFEVVEYRTKVPTFLQTSASTRTSSVFAAPKPSSAAPFSKARTLADHKAQTSYGKGFNTRESLTTSPFTKSEKDIKDGPSPQQDSDEKKFMHKRLGPNFDPSCISPHAMGSKGFNHHLDKAVEGSSKGRAISMKVEHGVNMNILKWSMQKRTTLVKTAFKQEMFSDSSQFQRIGVLSKASLHPPRTAGLQSRGRFFESAKPEDFLQESVDSLTSDDEGAVEIKKGKIPTSSKVSPSKAPKIYDLSKEDDYALF